MGADPAGAQALVERFAELFLPTGYYAASIPPRRVLREAAKRAGWHLPSPKIQQRQKAAAGAELTSLGGPGTPSYLFSRAPV